MKKLFTLLVILMTTLPLLSEQVTTEEARARAAAFLKQHGMNLSQGTNPAKTALRKTQPKTSSTAYYVFNDSSSKGFVIVSGDDRTDAILGYSTDGSFDEENCPANMKAWLDGYAAQIEALDSTYGTTGNIRKVKVEYHDSIPALLKTKWNQATPYNNYCPVVSDSVTMTGCVATSMAQVMYYHQWPQDYTTAIPAYTTKSREISMTELPATKFDWDNMPVSPDENDNTIAKLMLYCGQSVEMDYSPTESGAESAKEASALIQYFGYDQNVKYVIRNSYTTKEWDQMIYAELALQRPVIYGAMTFDDGHAFICDGYDGKGHYHINWGWSGEGDGFFKLSALDVDNDKYDQDQDAVIGIQKPTGDALEPVYLTGDSINHDGNSLDIVMTNNTSRASEFEVGWGNINDSGDIDTLSNLEKVLFPIHSTYPIYIDVSTLKSGTYKLVPISRETTTTVWKSALASNMYILANVDESGNVIFTPHPIDSIMMDSLTITGSNVVGEEQHISFKINNLGEEFNGVIYMFAGYAQNAGEVVTSFGKTLEANDTAYIHYDYIPTQEGDCHFWFATDKDCEEVICDTIFTFLPQDTTKYELLLKSKTFDKENQTVTITVYNNSWIDYTQDIYMSFYELEGDGTTKIIEEFTVDDLSIPEHQDQIISVTYDFPENKNLLVHVNYYGTTTSTECDKSFTVEGLNTFTTDINEAADTETEKAPYYTLQGVKVENPGNAGIYIHNKKKVMIK